MPQATPIRDAMPEDAVALARIHVIARATAMPWLATVHSDQETESWMAAEIVPRQRVRVATQAGVPVGFSAFAAEWLEQLYVNPEHQNVGIGSLLFNDVCAAAPAPFRFLGLSAQCGGKTLLRTARQPINQADRWQRKRGARAGRVVRTINAAAVAA
jgi:GNAT superfamily N-acetyltransferase